MSNDINTVFLTGTLGKDPEIKYFESGTVKTSFSIAVNKWNKKDEAEATTWFNIELWGKQAEFINNYAKKGSKVSLVGSICIEKYTSKNGEEKTKTFINADQVILTSKSQKTEEETEKPTKEIPF